MQKNILYSILISTFTLGLYGCSCSQVSKSGEERDPGLYLSQLSSFENEAFTVKVSLERDNTDEVTVMYSVSAIDPEGRTDSLAVVGARGVEGVDVVVTSGTLVFGGGATEVEATLDVINDALYEHSEKFLVTLSAASAGVSIVDGRIEFTIVNDDPAPVVTMMQSTDSLAEVYDSANNGVPESATVTLQLDTVSGVDAAVILSGTTDPSVDGVNFKVGETADYRSDYFVMQNDVVIQRTDRIIIPAGSTEVTIELKVIDDGMIENDEKFALSLIADADVKAASGADLAFLITDNDAPAAGFVKVSKLSDSGVLELPNLTAVLNAEADGSIGLDVTLVNKIEENSLSRAGFDYTKVDSVGLDVLSSVTPILGVTENDPIVVPWECVRDNTTGLLWEVKTRGDIGVRSESRRYYWYDSNYASNGGNPGERGGSVCLATSSSECNTSYYVADINHNKLCGMTGWRLPTIEELRTIIDYGIKKVGGNGGGVEDPNTSFSLFDDNYFSGVDPILRSTWTSTTDVGESNAERVRVIDFQTPIKLLTEETKAKSELMSIRLVNDSLQALVQKNAVQ